MYCPNCGTQNLDTAKFCKSCGTPLATQSNTDTEATRLLYEDDVPAVPQSPVAPKQPFMQQQSDVFSQPVISKQKKQKQKKEKPLNNGKSSKKLKIILAVVLSIVVIAGAVAAYIFTRPETRLAMAIKRTTDVSGMRIDVSGEINLGFESIILEFGDKTSDSKMIMNLTYSDDQYIYVDGDNFAEIDITDGYGDKYPTEELLKSLQEEISNGEEYIGDLSKVKLEDLIEDKHLNLEYISEFASLDKEGIKGALNNALKNKSATIEASGSEITLTLDTVDCINDTIEYLKDNDGEEILEIIAKLFDFENVKEFEEELKDVFEDKFYADAIKEIEIVLELDGGKISGVSLSHDEGGEYEIEVKFSNFNMSLKESFDDNDEFEKIVEVAKNPKEYSYDDYDDYDYDDYDDYDDGYYDDDNYYDYDDGYYDDDNYYDYDDGYYDDDNYYDYDYNY